MAAAALRCRPLMRLPIVVYRAGLGFVFGSRLLLLEHMGRRTHRARHVVVEVIEHSDAGTYVIASGFGTGAQWFRNVMTDPRVKVSTGCRRAVPAIARRLPVAEADAVLQRYIDAHPAAWESLAGVLDHTLDGRVQPPGTDLPMIELTVQ
ncbi:MAG: nitroreductase family deazaflavin-dependent oxidoreductase [Mycobacterium kyogaense]